MRKVQTILISNIRRIILVMAALLLVMLSSASVLAATAGEVCDEQGAVSGSLTCGKCGNHGCVWTTAAKSQQTCNDGSPSGVNTCLQNNQIVKDLNKIVTFLSIGVGLIIIIMLITGGIQYIAAGGNTNSTAEAKKRIIHAFIALAAFIFAFTFLQWLIPGGL